MRHITDWQWTRHHAAAAAAAAADADEVARLSEVPAE